MTDFVNKCLDLEHECARLKREIQVLKHGLEISDDKSLSAFKALREMTDNLREMIAHASSTWAENGDPTAWDSVGGLMYNGWMDGFKALTDQETRRLNGDD